MAEEQKYASEVIDLPSEGKVYAEGHPLRDGKIEIKYMTAKEEDILTSQNLIKKGVVIDKLLNSLILTEGVNTDDLVLGDKNAVMVAARVLAYGPEYECQVTHPETGASITTTVNLADCPFKKLPEEVTSNEFEIKLPVSKQTITFKLLTGLEEKKITEDIKASNKINSQISPELTTRLRYTITSVDGDNSQSTINNFVIDMLARDSLFLRGEIARLSPDINLVQDVEIGGETVEVDIPMTVSFFWPKS
jgi:hypothetical protein